LPAALAEGWRGLWQIRRLVFWVYLANLATALFALLPLYQALHRLTARRPAAGALISHWDVEVIAELVMDHPELPVQILGTFLFSAVAYLLLSQLLLGGVLGALARREPRAAPAPAVGPETEAAPGPSGDDDGVPRDRPGGSTPGAPHRPRPTAGAFGRDALEGFWPLCWLLLWSVIPYAVAAFAVVAGIALAVPASPWTLLAAALPGLLLLLWTDAALDYARALTMGSRAGGRLVTPSIRRLYYGFALVIRRPVAALTVHLAYGLASLVPVAAILFLLPDDLDAGGTAAVLGAFLIRQLLVLSRTAIRMASLGSHLALWFGHQSWLQASTASTGK
jgi:hypothetical protein